MYKPALFLHESMQFGEDEKRFSRGIGSGVGSSFRYYPFFENDIIKHMPCEYELSQSGLLKPEATMAIVKTPGILTDCIDGLNDGAGR